MIRSGIPEARLWVRDAVDAGLRVSVVASARHGYLRARDARLIEHRRRGTSPE